jgi:hypothetical protein
MAEGSVIEVATWRGTGRPDSRTSRLMLGMSPGNLADDASETTGYAGGQKEKKPEGFAKYIFMVKNILKSVIKLFMKLPVGKLKNVKFGKINLPKRSPKQNAPKVNTLASTTPISSESSISTSSSKESKAETKEAVDDWLAQIIKKAESNTNSDSKSKISASSTAKTTPIKKKPASIVKKTTKGKN